VNNIFLLYSNQSQTTKPKAKEQIQALEKTILSRGGSLHKDEKRDSRVIRVRQWTYDRLGELGSSKNDFDDVIFTLIEFWKKHHREK
jgi:hypothetical protein